MLSYAMSRRVPRGVVFAAYAILLLAPPSAKGQVVVLQPPPNVYGDGFGLSVAGLPDTDGDGWGDIAIGALQFQVVGDPRIGRVFTYSGDDVGQVRTLASPIITSGWGFGNVVCGMRDLDGDGAGDIVVGAYGNSEGGYFGRVHVFSGAAAGLLYSLRSERPATQASFAHSSVACAPDVDGDGIEDIVVGSPEERESDGGNRFGVAYVFSGATGIRIWRVVGTLPRDFGDRVAGLPDVDGDGRGDFAVGAVNQQLAPDLPIGALHVFSGATGALLYSLPVRCNTLAGVPDLDGDGRGDLLTGWDVGNVEGEPDGTGFVRVISGATGGIIRVVLSPRIRGIGFGSAVAGAPDLDGDGRGDILVGEIGARVANHAGAGAAYLVSGANGRLLRTLVSPNAQEYGYFGISVAAVPDVSDDGRPGILVGAFQEFTAGDVVGRAYLFHSCPADLNADGQATSQDFFDFLTAYFTQAPRADFNRDGALDSQDFFDFLAAFFNGCP